MTDGIKKLLGADSINLKQKLESTYMNNEMEPNPLNSDMSQEDWENNLDDLYKYLDMNLSTMSESELKIWLEVLNKIDPNIDYENDLI